MADYSSVQKYRPIEDFNKVTIEKYWAEKIKAWYKSTKKEQLIKLLEKLKRGEVEK